RGDRMADEPTYYQILGVDPAADAATIDAAYHGRSLRFRAGSFLDRREPAGPTQAEIERAYAVLRDPAARARYDAALAGGGPAAAFRWPARPAWLPWATAGVLCLLAVGILAAAISRSRSAPSGGCCRDRSGGDDLGGGPARRAGHAVRRAGDGVARHAAGGDRGDGPGERGALAALPPAGWPCRVGARQRGVAGAVRRDCG